MNEVRLAKLVRHRKLLRIPPRPDSPFYAFIYDNALLTLDMFEQHYDPEGEIRKVSLGDDIARWN